MSGIEGVGLSAKSYAYDSLYLDSPSEVGDANPLAETGSLNLEEGSGGSSSFVARYKVDKQGEDNRISLTACTPKKASAPKDAKLVVASPKTTPSPKIQTPKPVLLAQKGPAPRKTGQVPLIFYQMNTFKPSSWEKAHNWSNKGWFDNGWREDKVTFRKGIMRLQLDKSGCPKRCSGKPYVSGELRSQNEYLYGRFEAKIKAAKGNGVVTSFFIFSPADKAKRTGKNEIVFEILGKDIVGNTSKVQLNYYVNGVGKHEVKIPLRFDASKGFHTYAFDWSPKAIKWYVDGKLVHTTTASSSKPLPSKAGKIMMNLWPGSRQARKWSGRFRYTSPVIAKYDWAKYTPSSHSPKPARPARPATSPIKLRSITKRIISPTSIFGINGYNGAGGKIAADKAKGTLSFTANAKGKDMGVYIQLPALSVGRNDKRLVMVIQGKVIHQWGWAKWGSIQIVDGNNKTHILRPLCQKVWDDCKSKFG